MQKTNGQIKLTRGRGHGAWGLPSGRFCSLRFRLFVRRSCYGPSPWYRPGAPLSLSPLLVCLSVFFWCLGVRVLFLGSRIRFSVFGFRHFDSPALTHAGVVAASRLVRRDVYSICFSSVLHNAARPGPRPRQHLAPCFKGD